MMWVLRIGLIACLALPLGAASWEESLDRAESSFREGLAGEADAFVYAVREYHRALERGAPEDSRIYYNMGNALFLGGFPGEAVLSYRRALFYKPGDALIRENWERVAGETGAAVQEPGPFRVILFGGIFALGFKGARYGGLGLFALAWLTASAGLVFKRPRLFRPALILLLLSLWNAGLCRLWTYSGARQGVVLEEETFLRRGDSRGYERVREDPLPPGSAFRLLEEREGWLRVRLDDGGETGWLEEARTERLFPDRETLPGGAGAREG